MDNIIPFPDVSARMTRKERTEITTAAYRHGLAAIFRERAEGQTYVAITAADGLTALGLFKEHGRWKAHDVRGRVIGTTRSPGRLIAELRSA